MSQSCYRINVQIDTQKYTVISNYSNAHVMTAVDVLNEQLEQLKQLSPELDTQQRATLLALNTISKQIVLQQEIQRLNKQLKKMQIEMVEKTQPPQTISKKQGQRLSKQKDLFARQTSLEDFSNVFTVTNTNEVYKPALFNQKGESHE